MLTFQQIILKLQSYWDAQGCALLQPYDMEVGAGTSHTATFLRALGPEPWKAAYVQPSRRPRKPLRQHPTRLQHYTIQSVLEPSPADSWSVTWFAARSVLRPQATRALSEDDWRTLHRLLVPGLEVCLNGLDVTKHILQQVAHRCKRRRDHLRAERLAMSCRRENV